MGRQPLPDSSGELAQLAESGGLEPVGLMQARRDKPDPATYIGSGKVEELKAAATGVEAGLVVFDVALSAAQQRNLERALDCAVVDRTALILDIFRQRAKSREGRLQVELASLEHLSARLVRGWTHLERQRGGLSKTGGPGEKQIELDRRMIGVRVKQLREKLRQLERQRHTQRRSRARSDVLSVSLVGYTNAGKSTLFNSLTRAGAYAADQLFATLDTTSRRCYVGEGVNVVLSDTVGFIRGLPHQLVEAFKSTLDETARADLLLHVVDAASPAREDQIAEVERVLAEIGADRVPRMLVLNKIDLAQRAPSAEGPDARGNIAVVSVSAAQGLGLDLLREAIAQFARAALEPVASGEAVERLEQPA
ncbi:MAG: GTPase HflX [Pseudomonadota bacterium]